MAVDLRMIDHVLNNRSAVDWGELVCYALGDGTLSQHTHK